jgi:UDP-3-O-[3-hydroxymyristoyl] glucosamine N-acyltransferase
MGKPRSLGELAALVGGRVAGDAALPLIGVAPLDLAGPQHLSVFHHPRYREQLRKSRAGAVVVSPEVAASADVQGKNLLVTAEPYLAFAKIAVAFHERPAVRPGIHATAVVDDSANVDPSAEVGALAYVGPGVVVGARSVLRSGVTLEAETRVGEGCLLHARSVVRERCVLGDRVILQPGAVVGSDGFGYAFDPVGNPDLRGRGPHHLKVPQVGIVVLEDDVELGANACVDRATLGETRIGRGTKIDNLVQVAHNVTIGPNSILCAQAGIAGSSALGEGVILGGQAGVSGHLKLGKGAKLGAQSGVMDDIPDGEAWGGFPAHALNDWFRTAAAVRRLPGLLREIAKLKKQIAELERRIAGASVPE